MSGADDVDGEPMEQFDWVIPTRLAAATSVPDNIQESLGLTGVLDAAKHCYRLRSLGATLSSDENPLAPADRWLRVALGLSGSIAESLVVAAACEVEVELLRMTGEAEAEIGGRFFSIASAQEVVGIGHRLTNLVQRAVCARPGYGDFLRASSDRSIAQCASVEDPRSASPAAWLSLNQPTVRAMMRALRPVRHSSIRSGLAAIVALARSAEWTILNETRGEVFHRSRPESSVASGLDSFSGYVTPIRDADGNVIGESVGTRTRYAGGDGRWGAETGATRAALRRVATCAVEVTTAIADAVEPLTMGRRFISVSPDGGRAMSQRIGGSWSERSCTCCSRADSVDRR